MSPAIHNLPLPGHEPRRARRITILLVSAAATGLLTFVAGFEARAQVGAVGSPPKAADFQDDDSRGPRQISSRDEMLKNVAVKRREMAYKENIERAKESATLGIELRQTFAMSKTLGAAEQKKLGRMEKLTRTIREAAGGGDDKEELKELPHSIEASLVRLQELSEELQVKVEKTPRHVISTTVISSANQLLELIRHIRASAK